MNETTIGQPVPRVDGVLKVTGRATYAAEHDLPHLVHAVMVTSTVAKGRVKKLDVTAAEHAVGVLSVITHRNAPRPPSPWRPITSFRGSSITLWSHTPPSHAGKATG
jgi:xanthine dehydrogenase YagR molybdenum-binding subunit